MLSGSLLNFSPKPGKCLGRETETLTRNAKSKSKGCPEISKSKAASKIRPNPTGLRTIITNYVSLFKKWGDPRGGGTCYVGVPEDVLFSWVYFLPENSKAGYPFCPKILK